jgi:hypothetical protein
LNRSKKCFQYTFLDECFVGNFSKHICNGPQWLQQLKSHSQDATKSRSWHAIDALSVASHHAGIPVHHGLPGHEATKLPDGAPRTDSAEEHGQTTHQTTPKDNDMLKSFIAALTITGALATSSFAADAPKDSDECLKKAISLAESAEEKKLPDDKLAKIEDLLTKLEGHCENKQFPEAASVSTEIEGVIAGK